MSEIGIKIISLLLAYKGKDVLAYKLKKMKDNMTLGTWTLDQAIMRKNHVHRAS